MLRVFDPDIVYCTIAGLHMSTILRFKARKSYNIHSELFSEYIFVHDKNNVEMLNLCQIVRIEYKI